MDISKTMRRLKAKYKTEEPKIKTVTVVEAKGELEFGTKVEDTTGWMIDLSRFFSLWHEKTLWIVSRVGDFETYIKANPELKWREIMRENGLVLFTNKEQA
jgi:hypothetical protein